MNKILSTIVSMFDSFKDPWAKYRNKGGPISAETGEVMLCLAGIGALVCLSIRF